MKSTKFLALCMSIIMVAGILLGCTSQGNVQDQAQGPVSDTVITVTDHAGRTIKLDKPAEKVVSVYYISTALLIALDCEDKLCAIEMKADTRPLYKLAAEEIIQLPAVGSGKGINVEAIAQQHPELVVIPKKLVDSVAALEELGINVVVVDPETEKGFLECVDMLGKLCGKQERSAALSEYYLSKKNEMRALTQNVDRPKVYFSSASSYFSTCTSEMYQTELIYTAGGECVSKEIEDTYWKIISPEQLIMWNPDYIFHVVDADYSKEDIYADEALSEINAVVNERVYRFPSAIEAWDYPTPSSVLGVMWLTNVLHPELYPDELYLSEAKDFYREFFGIEVSAEQIGC